MSITPDQSSKRLHSTPSGDTPQSKTTRIQSERAGVGTGKRKGAQKKLFNSTGGEWAEEEVTALLAYAGAGPPIDWAECARVVNDIGHNPRTVSAVQRRYRRHVVVKDGSLRETPPQPPCTGAPPQTPQLRETPPQPPFILTPPCTGAPPQTPQFRATAPQTPFILTPPCTSTGAPPQTPHAKNTKEIHLIVTDQTGRLVDVSSQSFTVILKKLIGMNEFRSHLANEVFKTVELECRALCSDTNPSLLKSQKIEDLENFKIQRVAEEISSRAPTFWGMLKAAAGPKHCTVKDLAPFACMALFIRSQKMSLWANLNGLIMDHMGLKDEAISCFNKQHMCTSVSSIREKKKKMSARHQVLIKEMTKS